MYKNVFVGKENQNQKPLAKANRVSAASQSKNKPIFMM